MKCSPMQGSMTWGQWPSGADPEGGGQGAMAPPPKTVGLLCYIICLK